MGLIMAVAKVIQKVAHWVLEMDGMKVESLVDLMAEVLATLLVRQKAAY